MPQQQPTNTTITHLLPFAASPVPAGFPSPADDFMEQGVDLNEKLITHPSATFLVRASGYSMINAGIHPNDILIVNRALEPTNNAIVIALLNNEFTVKRYKKSAKGVKLQSENSKFPSFSPSHSDQFEIWGVVTYIIHPANL